MITTASRVTRSLSAVASANVLDPIPGIGLVELYDLSPLSNSKVGNISTRGSVGTQDNILISSFIIGDVDSATVVVRALGPTLASFGVSGVLSDPTLTIYDSGGSVIATNDNWQDGNNALDVQRSGLAPPNALESAIVLHLPAGAYTAVVRGANGATGKCLSRGLRPRLALLSDGRVAATRQADTTGFSPVPAPSLSTHRARISRNFVLDSVERDLIKGRRSRPVTFQRIFGRTEVVVCGMIDAGSAPRAIANNWSRDSAK